MGGQKLTPFPGHWEPRYLGYVLLADQVLPMFNLLWVAGYEDAPPLAATVWLADVRLVFPHAPVGLEIPIAM